MGIIYILSIPISILLIDTIWCKKIWCEKLWKFQVILLLLNFSNYIKFFSQEQRVIFLFVFYFINIKGIVHP